MITAGQVINDLRDQMEAKYEQLCKYPPNHSLRPGSPLADRKSKLRNECRILADRIIEMQNIKQSGQMYLFS